jgi:hypothetical protein
MSTPPHVESKTLPCKQCGSVLVIHDVLPGEWIRCASCGALTEAAPAESAAPGEARGRESGDLSRPAVRAGWLGAASILPLVGLAALVAGILGVRDIVRYPARRGMKRAIFGIVAGAASTLAWLAVAGVAAIVSMVARTTIFTSEPLEVVNLSAQIAEFELPEGFSPYTAHSSKVLETKRAAYALWIPTGGTTETPYGPVPAKAIDAVIAMGRYAKRRFPQSSFALQDVTSPFLWNRRTQVVVSQTAEVPAEIDGMPVVLTRKSGIDPEFRDPRRQYSLIVEKEEHLYVIVVITGDEPPDAAADDPRRQFLTEDEVLALFRSFQFVDP